MSNFLKKFKLSIFLYFVFFSFNFLKGVDHSLVFVHIGNSLPSYLNIALSQAILFSPDTPIILVSNQTALNTLSKEISNSNIIKISCESLKRTPEHDRFIQQFNARSNQMNKSSYTRYTSERFLILYDLMVNYDLKNVFHLENDIMLYTNLADLTPHFLTRYNGIAATFISKNFCIASFMYIPNAFAMKYLANFFSNNIKNEDNDMLILAKFGRLKNRDIIDYLPVVPDNYFDNHSLKPKDIDRFSNNYELFQSIFDAAAIGQYLGGTPKDAPGFINTNSIFNPSLLKYKWIVDDQGRSVPYAVYNGKMCKINNLHIHSKKLHLFTSI